MTPSGCPGGTSRGSHSGRTGTREPAPVAGLRPCLALVVERDVADLRRDRVDELAGQPVGEEPGQQQEPADPRPQLRLVAGEHVRLGLGPERGDRVARRRAALNASPHRPPIRGSPSARQRSSQTIAGRSGSPSSSVTTTVPRCVVSATPASASRRTSRAREQRAGTPRRAPASRGPRPARSSRAGPGRTARSGPWRSPRACRPGRTPSRGRSGCRRRARGRGRRSCRGPPAGDGGRSTPGFMIPSGSNVRTTASSAAIPSAPFSAARYGAWSAPTPWWWLIVAALGDDRVRGGALEPRQRSASRRGRRPSRKR